MRLIVSPSYSSSEGIAAPADDRKVVAVLQSESGQLAGPQLELPVNITPEQLTILCNSVVGNVRKMLICMFQTKFYELIFMPMALHGTLQEEDDAVPYRFFVNDEEITDNISAVVAHQGLLPEHVLHIVYQPQVPLLFVASFDMNS